MKTSDVCSALDGQVFPVKDALPGVNHPPMHPWCRSTTIAVIDGAVTDGLKRRAKDPETNEVYEVPANMTYEQWKKDVDDKYGAGFVDKKRKMWYNKAVDEAQYKSYKDRLGDDAPETFVDFQKLKYDDETKYSELVGFYRYKGEVKEATVADYKAYKAIKALGEKGVVRVPPLQIDVSALEVFNDHAYNHGCTLDDAKEYITSAKCSIIRKKWDGKHTNYYSFNGATYLNEDGKVNTIFSKDDFDPKTIDII